MTQRYRDLACTPAVREAQAKYGSADHYASMAPADDKPDELGPNETAFIVARDSFYMSTISESGWPYIQHRGGPLGFVKVLSPHRIAIADYRGNRQYMSVGHLTRNNRASLFFMDYANRRRLKVMAHASVLESAEDRALVDSLKDGGYRAAVERALVFDIEAFDWNCPQHITQRFTEAELHAIMAAAEHGA